MSMILIMAILKVNGWKTTLTAVAAGVGAATAVGVAPLAHAAPTARQHTPRDFLAAVRTAGVTGTDPAMLEDGYSVCWQLWNGRVPPNRVVAGLQHDYPQLTVDQAADFVKAAYADLCPVPGAYDYWAYSTS